MSYVSHADLGGTLGHGPVVPEPEDEVFHAPWEPRVLALALAMGATGAWNLDMSRAARETLPEYARSSYYRIWFDALERQLQAHALVAADEIAAGRSLRPPAPLPRVLKADAVAASLARGTPTARAVAAPARFAPGDRVRARAERVDHHTRLPGYARGHIGTVTQVHGGHVFADAHAHGLGEDPQWLYTVAFEAGELWPDADDPARLVSIDAWEPYLEAA